MNSNNIQDSETGEDVSDKSAKGPMNQPWFKEAYKAAVKFYEKDDVLDSRDREELYKAYNSISGAQMFGGWLGFSSVFIPPFFYQYYKTKEIKGVKVPRNFVIGLVALAGSSFIAGNIAYKKQLQRLDPDNVFGSTGDYGDDALENEQNQFQKIKPPAQRQYEMMTLLKNGSATRWAAYFSVTQKNPEKRLPNPMIKLQEIQQEGLKRSSYMNQRDPIGLYKDIPEKKKEHLNPGNNKTGPVDGNTTSDNSVGTGGDSWSGVREEHKTSSSWDRIRVGNSQASKPASSSSPFDVFENEEENKSGVNPPLDVPALPIQAHVMDRTISQEEFDKLLENERNND